MNKSTRRTRPDSSVRLVLNPAVEREYAFLIKQAEAENNSDRASALKKGLERARRRADEEKAAS